MFNFNLGHATNEELLGADAIDLDLATRHIPEGFLIQQVDFYDRGLHTNTGYSGNVHSER